jgi:NhaA family Na+:H+ antiporter
MATSERQTRAGDDGLSLVQRFLRLESAGGLLLMAATVVALGVANTPLHRFYAALLNVPLRVSIGSFAIAKPLLLWINDGLMAVFFFLVGMELKREVVEGHLSSLRRASLPAFAAAGGMLVPTLCYVAFNWRDPAAMKGWAIPAATDIAFALGILSLLGSRVPTALKAFLLSVAIFDDLGAIVVIALFYTASLSVGCLVVAAALIVVLALLNRAGVSKAGPYFVVGVPLWVAVLKSGVHATLAGVVLAMFIPIHSPQKDAAAGGTHESLLHQLEHSLHPWVAFGVLPIFAFANAGVSFAGTSIGDVFRPVPLGIATGLFVGKQAGIVAFCWLGVTLGLASRPQGVGWGQLYGAALLCGIGFTMSLFIASLAFDAAGPGTETLDRIGILAGTLLSGAAGYLVLRAATRPTIIHQSPGELTEPVRAEVSP